MSPLIGVALDASGLGRSTQPSEYFVFMLSRSFVMPRHRLHRLLGVVVVASLVSFVTAAPVGADVSFINAQRARSGLPAVVSHGGLSGVAARQAAEMASAGKLFHSSNLGAKVSAVLTYQAVAENVGVGASVSAVNAMFMQSAGHRVNILGNYNVAAVGTATSADGRVWVAQIFVRAAGVATATAPRTTAAPRPTVTAPRPTAPRVSRSAPRTSVPAAPAPPPPSPAAVAGLSSLQGYRVVARDGGVFTFGNAVFAGSAAELDLDEDIVGGAATPTGEGYLLFGARGGVFAFGDAVFAGSAADVGLNAPVVAGAVTPSGAGYHLFSADGGVLTFGDATFAGSLLDVPRNAAIVGGARTSSGRGYWLAGADGGVYALGDAPFLGSAAELGALAAPVLSITATPSGKGYWLVAADGGVFAFGDAGYFGSLVGDPGAAVRSLIAAPGAKGYWLVRADREVVPFGTVDAPPRHFFGLASLHIV